jgi:hypothetical protein
MPPAERTASIVWTVAVALVWPIMALGAFLLTWGPEPVRFLPPVLSVMGIAMFLTAPGALAIAAAEESPRWRRIIAAAVALTTAVTLIAFGMLAFDTVGCQEPAGPATVALSMLPTSLVVAAAAGITAWQGGRLVTRFRRVGIPLAFLLGWGMLAVAILAALYRSMANSCFGY